MSENESRMPTASATVVFTRLEPEDKEVYSGYYNRQPLEISDLCFNSRIAWRVGFHYHKAVIEDSLVVVAQNSVWTGLHFSFPLGLTSCETLERILDEIWHPYADMEAALTGEEPQLRFLFVPEKALSCFEHLSSYSAEILCKREFSDYVYEAEALRSLKGKALKNKRNHFSRFQREYPEAVYAPFRPTDIEEALELTRAWCAEKGLDPMDIRQSDYLAIEALLRAGEKMDLRGGTLRNEGTLIAFSLYSLRGEEMAYCHFEKAASGHELAYTAITHLTVKNEFPTVRWLNREEDMGLEGLRKAKMSYHPDHLVDKYEIIIRKKEADYGQN